MDHIVTAEHRTCDDTRPHIVPASVDREAILKLPPQIVNSEQSTVNGELQAFHSPLLTVHRSLFTVHCLLTLAGATAVAPVVEPGQGALRPVEGVDDGAAVQGDGGEEVDVPFLGGADHGEPDAPPQHRQAHPEVVPLDGAQTGPLPAHVQQHLAQAVPPAQAQELVALEPKVVVVGRPLTLHLYHVGIWPTD